MGQINLAFTSKNIDPKDHILSVLIEADSFVYGIFDKKHDLISAGIHTIDRHSDDLLSAIRKDGQLVTGYHKAIVAYSTLEFVHLNALDFDAGDFSIYFNGLTNDDEILTDAFTHSEVKVVFPVNRKMRGQIVGLLSPYAEVHVSTAMQQHIYPSQAKRNLVLVGADIMHYMSYNGGHLSMYNAYRYRTKEDFLYYLQLASDFSGIDREVDVLEVGGWLDMGSDIYKMVSPYYKHIQWVDMARMGMSTASDDHLKHHYFALYANALCVS